MGNGNDSILEAYLFETNSLLEQLDSLVLAAEEKDSFSEEDVNTIFRIMHTIKGSSAMMEYSSLMTIAHRAEDLFAIVRDKSMEIVPEALRPALFDLLFQIIDFFRGDGHKIQFLFKMDLPSVGFLEMTLGAGKEQVDVSVYGPDSVTAHSGLIAEDLGQILADHGLKGRSVQVQKHTRPLTLTEVFPGLFEGERGINVKI